MDRGVAATLEKTGASRFKGRFQAAAGPQRRARFRCSASALQYLDEKVTTARRCFL